MIIIRKKLLILFVSATVIVAVASCSQSPFAAKTQEVAEIQIPETNIEIDRNKILESHNFIRQRLGVPPLRWSTQLEAFAADWANFLTDEGGCVARRRGSIGLPLHKNGIGENLQSHEPLRFDDGRIQLADIDENQVVLEWARQAIDYNYASNSCASNKNCDDYTQLVWRDSQVVGCAVASCPGMEQIWVCNYDPPGNFFNQKPY